MLPVERVAPAGAPWTLHFPLLLPWKAEDMSQGPCPPPSSAGFPLSLASSSLKPLFSGAGGQSLGDSRAHGSS